jgi:MFS family permease
MIRRSSRLPKDRLRLILVWIWALLGPILLVIAINWKLNHYRTEEFSIRVNRQVVQDVARSFLAEHGIDSPGTQRPLRVDRNMPYMERLHRIQQDTPPAVGVQELPVPPVVFIQEFHTPGQQQLEVGVAPDGRVVRFALEVAPSATANPVDDPREQALHVAERQLPFVLRYRDQYQLSEPRIYEQPAQTAQPLFRVEWTAFHRHVPEIAFVVGFGVTGEQVYSQNILAYIDDTRMETSYVSAIREVLSTVAPFYFLAIGIWLLARYLQRTLEHEVSQGRALVIAVAIVVMLGSLVLFGDHQVLMNVQFTGDSSLTVLLLGIIALAAAMFTGACYAAGEADVRERFPRSLTSFDAMLTGRILSRNVARSFLLGFAAACWLFAIQVFASHVFERGLEVPNRIVSVYQLAVSEAPFLYVFLMLPLGLVVVMIMGLLAPLSIVARLRKRSWLSWTLFCVISFINLMILQGGYATAEALTLTVGTELLALLTLILAVDLLSSLVCLVLLSYFGLLTNAQLLTLMPDYMQWLMHCVVTATALVSLVLLRKGPELRAEDVRPAYAHALAERQSLSRQISTAALAQRQLMVSELPQTEGLSLAAHCKTARAVSGDYFDGYLLAPGKLGILLISGAGRGLLDAMVMAFAKGFLLDHAKRTNSARQTLEDLLQTLTSVLKPEDRFPELCYVILDSETETVSFSRTPDFPEPFRVHMRQESPVTVRMGGASENVEEYMLCGSRRTKLVSGSFPLDSSTTVLAYTRGFANNLYLGGVLDVREWLRAKWAKITDDDVSTVLQRLGTVAFRVKDWQEFIPKEDVTLVVARLQHRPTQTNEVKSKRERAS